MPLDDDDDFSAARAARRAGTSFYWAMRLLSRPRREAMFALYAWCRELDDIADEEAPPEDKLARLADWREEIERLFAGRPRTALARALAGPVAEFTLPRAEFVRVIDGMEMDARGEMVAPDLDALRRYCRRVAGAVGMISLPIFGCRGEAAERFAKALGEALQFTNILRDLDEDAALGRLYLPAPLLGAAGVTARDPAGALRDPALPLACEALAGLAEAAFAEATAMLRQTDRRPLRPALAMMAGYRRLLDRLRRRGWATRRPRPRLTPGETLWIALVHMWRP